MRRRLALALLVAALGCCGAAAQTPPDASDLLFETPQWQTAAPGTTLTYRYARTSPLAAVFGEDIQDTITLTLEPSAAADARTVRVDMFSQKRHRAAGPFEDSTGNPVLVLFLENHVEALARALGANPRYLKNAIRAGLRERATVTPVPVDVAGGPVPGYRVETKPFAGDPMKERLRGLDTLAYTFIAADRVPGAIRSIAVEALGADGTRLFSESLTLDANAP